MDNGSRMRQDMGGALVLLVIMFTLARAVQEVGEGARLGDQGDERRQWGLVTTGGGGDLTETGQGQQAEKNERSGTHLETTSSEHCPRNMSYMFPSSGSRVNVQRPGTHV